MNEFEELWKSSQNKKQEQEEQEEDPNIHRVTSEYAIDDALAYYSQVDAILSLYYTSRHGLPLPVRHDVFHPDTQDFVDYSPHNIKFQIHH